MLMSKMLLMWSKSKVSLEIEYLLYVDHYFSFPFLWIQPLYGGAFRVGRPQLIFPSLGRVGRFL